MVWVKELQCTECLKDVQYVDIIVLEEHKYRLDDSLIYTGGDVIDGSEHYYDVECPICKKLMQRFYDSKKLEAWIEMNFVEAE